MEIKEEVENKQIMLKGYIDRAPLESDMEIKMGNKIKLKIKKGCNSVLIKNLYLSCDPYMRGRMREYYGSDIPPFVPGKPIEGFGVSKVIDSEMTGWEEYSLIEDTNKPKKIKLKKKLKTTLMNKCFPEGIDIYFENVGGAMLDAVLLNLRFRGRIAVCGMVSISAELSWRGGDPQPTKTRHQPDQNARIYSE